MMFQHEITLEELVKLIKTLPHTLVLSLERPFEQQLLADSTSAPDKNGRPSPAAMAVRLPGKIKRTKMAKILHDQA